MPGNVDGNRLKLLQGLHSQLTYHKLLGLRSYPRSSEIVSFLHSKAGPQRAEFEKMNRGVAPQPARQSASAGQESGSGASLDEIAEEVRSCQACELYNHRIYAVPGSGSEHVRLMIIGDWLTADDSGRLPAGLLFGVEQDRMLGKMVEAINLPQHQVFITNVIKCAIGSDCQPQAAHVSSCSSYLRCQIAVLMPEVICTMGMIAARAVLEMSQPLSRLRQQFHSYHPRQDVAIPVLATYHPGYLLQNTEMKRAAWMDLQLLGKKLGLQF